MRITINTSILIFAGFILIFALLALFINLFIYNFPGNNYFPPNAIQIGLSLVLFYAGLTLQVGKDKFLTKVGLELIYFFLVMSLIALATNAVQLTPFPPIDHSILALEKNMGINMKAILTWTHQHPTIHLILAFTYDSLTNQMSIIPLFIIGIGRFDLIREYYFLLLLTVLIGFGFYYFYPTMAPASVIDSPYFTPYQIATGVKFIELHNHTSPSTIEGGLIALPSFHCIWAIFCVYLLKDFRVLFPILGLANILLIISCVLLGWHYSIDIVAGLLLAGLSCGVLQWNKFQSNTKTKTFYPSLLES